MLSSISWTVPSTLVIFPEMSPDICSSASTRPARSADASIMRCMVLRICWNWLTICSGLTTGSVPAALSVVRLGEGECYVALRARRRMHTARRKLRADREWIAAGNSDENVLAAVNLINSRNPERPVGQIFGAQQLARIFVQRVELRVIARKQNQPSCRNDE